MPYGYGSSIGGGGPFRHAVVVAGQFEEEPLDLGIVGFLGEGARAARIFTAQLNLKRLRVCFRCCEETPLARGIAFGDLPIQMRQMTLAGR